ncbi:MAG TPA: hypothetical protein ENF26_02460 [Methanomicrobia archaeon]|nr:hypothetical protein [Methanomicrobia archaeon]HEX58994.1 hypothetical protein [Methanomicrobia archaeon]
MSLARELVRKCGEVVSPRPLRSPKIWVEYFKLLLLSLSLRWVEADKSGIERISGSRLELSDFAFDNKDELRRFLRVCDDRIARARVYMTSLSLLTGFGVTILSIMLDIALTLVGEETMETTIRESTKPLWTLFTKVLLSSYPLFSLVLLAIVVVVAACAVGLLYYRAQIYVWTTFKEAAVLHSKVVAD